MKELIFWIVLGLALGLVVFLLLPTKVPPSKHSFHLQSMRKLSKLRYFIAAYQDEHDGALPESIPDLIPNYISSSESDCIFAPWVKPMKLQKILENPNLYTNSGYVYLGAQGKDLNIILYENIAYFTNSAINDPNTVYYIHKDYGVKTLPVAQLKQMLGKIKHHD